MTLYFSQDSCKKWKQEFFFFTCRYSLKLPRITYWNFFSRIKWRDWPPLRFKLFIQETCHQFQHKILKLNVYGSCFFLYITQSFNMRLPTLGYELLIYEIWHYFQHKTSKWHYFQHKTLKLNVYGSCFSYIPLNYSMWDFKFILGFLSFLSLGT